MYPNLDSLIEYPLDMPHSLDCVVQEHVAKLLFDAKA